MVTTALHPPEEILLGFARALRAAGVAVTADRERAYLQAAAEVGLADATGVYVAGRATLCGSPADLERYDLVYAAWFTGQRAVVGQRSRPPAIQAQAGLSEGATDGVPGQPENIAGQASATEVLRHRDVATLTTGEKAELARLYGRLRPRAPRRPSHRRTPAARGDLDRRRTLRESVRRLGEPGEVRWRRRAPRTRLAEGVKVFLDRWGRRGMARGAVVVIFSDGWERSDPEALGEQVRRLSALAHRVVWVNPHRGQPGYEPVQGGIRAVLPHCDDFVAGHSFAAFEELTEVIARA